MADGMGAGERRRHGIIGMKGIVAVLLLTAALAGCRSSGGTPSRLMGKTYSYQSLQRVQRVTGIRTWQTLEDRRPLPSDTRPPFRILTISVAGYYDLGYVGELQMTFFNDRLMRVAFYPQDIEGYKRAVESEQGFQFSAEGGANVDRDTHVWVGKDQNDRMYVGWEDKTLKREYDAWVRQYT